MNEDARAHRKASISFRLEGETAARINEIAAEERRPVSNLVRCIVSDWVAEQAKAGHVSTVG